MTESRGVFLNYRRSDTGPVAARLLETLERELESGQVFVDREGIESGEDWADRLSEELAKCSVFLCLIGDRWLKAKDEFEQRRIDGPEDWVRREIQVALSRVKSDQLVVVPVLVDDAKLPPKTTLPEPVQSLPRRQSRRLRSAPNRDWECDVQDLVKFLCSQGLVPRRRVEPADTPLRDEQPSELTLLIQTQQELRGQGKPTVEVDEQIRQLKRDLRTGPTIPAGYVFGDRFELKEELGKGGFGVVWKAWDSQANQFAAAKVLHGHFSRDSERQRRFSRGAEQMSRLNHPRIVRVLHLPRESDDGYWWYAMEFVPGGSLKDAVFEQRLNRQATMEVLSDVADALDHAWQTERLVHRDVKPANILLDREGRGKLTDFDLVKAPDSTQLTIAVGDFDFGAPEVLRESGQPSPASDAYSLARTALFAFSAGKVPGRSGNSIEDVIAAAGLNQSQAKILKQTLQENPTDRVATPRAFMEALRRDEGEVPGTSPQPQSTSEPVRCSPSSIRVFLSYATEDADQARKLTEDLKRQGVDVRLDRDELVGGQLWRPAIEKAIRDASHFIALLSSRSVDRRGFVQKELRVALDVLEEHSDLSSYLIPVRLDECELSHSALAELHWVDLFPDFERGVRRIVASLGLSPLDPTAENGAEAETRSDNPAGYELVWIPSGTFEMGSREAEEGRWDDEGPVHTVTVQRGFYLGKYPVTNEQYAKFLQTKQGMREPDHGRGGRFGQSQQPVVGVSWDEAKAFCEWAGLILPGEAQWEYACRAGTRTRFWSGDKDSDLERVAWYADNSEGQPHSGGENPPNDFGLCDMHGNVWEWCQDTWHDTYVDAPTDGSAWCEKTTGTDYRVLRGGSWHNLAQLCRSASRDWRPAGARYAGVGFRPARSSD